MSFFAKAYASSTDSGFQEHSLSNPRTNHVLRFPSCPNRLCTWKLLKQATLLYRVFITLHSLNFLLVLSHLYFTFHEKEHALYLPAFCPRVFLDFLSCPETYLLPTKEAFRCSVNGWYWHMGADQYICVFGSIENDFSFK